MIRKILLAMISALMLCACGGTAKTDMPVSPAKEINLVGDWKEDTDNSSYFYAIIAGNTIEIYIQSEDTRSLYWAGSYKEPDEPVTAYTWVSENDFTKTKSAMMASGDETKEFTYENGILSFYSKIMGVESTRKLKKVSDTPSVDNMKSTITVSQSELKQPELVEFGGSFGTDSNYYNYAALIRNPNENMGIEFADCKVVVKDKAGTILAVNDGAAGPLHAGETILVSGAVDCAGGVVETIDFSVSCDKNDFKQNLSGVDSRNFYFNSLTYLEKGSYVYDKSITGVLINNTNTRCPGVMIKALYRKNGEIVCAETDTTIALQPGENVFQFDRHRNCGEFDTIELFAEDQYVYSNETVSGFTPLDGLKNENTLYFTENGVTTEKPSIGEPVSETTPETTAEPAEEASPEPEAAAEPSASTEAVAEPSASPETSSKPEVSAEPSASGEMSLEEFKTKMDSLEEFFNSYAEFMKSYDSSNMEMLGKYTEMLGKYTEAMTALDEIDETALTPEQKAYYTEVMLRINKTLMEAAVSIQG